jgi:hypothetical protein
MTMSSHAGDSRRAALEIAAAMRGLSVAGFVEVLVDRALADAGLIEQPNPGSDVAAARR